jgi:hypothetical protein
MVDDLAEAVDGAAGRSVSGGGEEWYFGFRVLGVELGGEMGGFRRRLGQRQTNGGRLMKEGGAARPSAGGSRRRLAKVGGGGLGDRLSSRRPLKKINKNVV